MAIIINLMALQIHAQTESNIPSGVNGPSVGFGAVQSGDDAGLSANFTSPSFFHHALTIRFSPGVQWSECYFAHANKWSSYATIKAGLVYTIQTIDRTRIYAEAGSVMIFPNSILSAKKQLQGGYGVVGLDLFVYSKSPVSMAYYIECGYIGVKAYAEKLEQATRYSNGINFSTGFRIYF